MHVSVLPGRIGADDEKVGAGRDPAMACSGRQKEAIAGRDSKFHATWTAEHDMAVTPRDTEHLVRAAVIVVIIIDAIPPSSLPAIAGEGGFKGGGEIVALADRLAINDDGKLRIVRNDGSRFEQKTLDDHTHLAMQACGANEGGRRKFQSPGQMYDTVQSSDRLDICPILRDAFTIG